MDVIAGSGRRSGANMRVVFPCREEEEVLGTHKAPGSCPYCGGAVMATYVESAWRLCFLPLCRKIKCKFSCTRCSRRLVAYP